MIKIQILLKDLQTQIKAKYPRIFYLVTKVQLPLLGLIGLCFFFGFVITQLEYQNEINNNNRAFQQFSRYFKAMGWNDQSGPTRTPRICIMNWVQNTLELKNNSTIVDEFCKNTNLFNNSSKVFSGLTVDLYHLYQNEVTFNFINCPTVDVFTGSYRDEDESGKPIMVQSTIANVNKRAFNYSLAEWFMSVEAMEDYLLEKEGKNRTNIMNETFREERLLGMRAEKMANGFTRCKVNVPGGALFWFTVMTTIGYGNVVPVTLPSWILVMSFGFLCILHFSACIGIAGRFALIVFEDIALRLKMSRLTKGRSAAIFWFVMVYIWVLTIAFYRTLLQRKKLIKEERETFRENCWFGFASITTVGFGDYYLTQQGVSSVVIFIVTALMLTGFVIIANFAQKLIEVVQQSSLGAQTDADWLADKLAETRIPEGDRYIGEALPRTSEIDDERGKKCQTIDKKGGCVNLNFNL